jgi:sec-independent protein translocase protein TatB
VFNLQGSEIVMILLVALVVLGPEKLPEAVRKFTQTYAELKKMSSGFQSELKSALDEPMREMRETAGLVRNAADPTKLMAEMENEERVLKAGERAASEPASEPAPSESGAATTDGET